MKSSNKTESIRGAKAHGKKLKTIKSKFVTCTIALFLTVGIVVSSISAYAIYSSTFTSLEKSMTAAVSLASTGITKQIEIFDSILVEIAANDIITSRTESEHSKAQYLSERAKDYAQYGAAFYIADTKGNVYNSNRSVSNRDFYKASISGEKFLTSPEKRDDNGELGVVYSIPLRNVFGRIGVIFMEVNYNALYDVLASASIGATGSAYALNSTGDTVLHRNQDLVLTKSNTSNDVLTDPTLKPLANLEQRAMAGENGFGFYSYGGVNKFATFAPIDGTAGWSVVVTAERNEFMSGLWRGIILCVISMAICVIAAVLVMTRLAIKVTEPIDKCVNRLEKLAKGDLTSEMPHIDSDDETKILASSTETIVKTIHFIINDMGRMLKHIGNGDFTVSSENGEMYVGDFNSMLASMRQIVSTLSNTLNQINEASDQVASGSDQVSSSAQALSQGATEQAASIQELAATITHISENVAKNAENAQLANHQARQTASELEGGKQQMDHMTEAMIQINNFSNDIGKIIKTIEDIAFQTNILALNAAVEAARAGEAGKGFAVVADEVRNLAGKSADASKNTAQLIEATVSAVQQGTDIARKTAESLDRIVISSEKSAGLVESITLASNQQADSIRQITQGIDQISSVVQTNSATAEQSAAASEELSGQAQTLKSLVSQFKLPTANLDYRKILSQPEPTAKRLNSHYSEQDKY